MVYPEACREALRSEHVRFRHLNTGHAYMNPYVRRFRAVADEAAGAQSPEDIIRQLTSRGLPHIGHDSAGGSQSGHLTSQCAVGSADFADSRGMKPGRSQIASKAQR